jgi:hypothetical protein
VGVTVSSLIDGAVVGVWRIALLEQDDPPCRTKAAVPSRTDEVKGRDGGCDHLIWPHLGSF